MGPRHRLVRLLFWSILITLLLYGVPVVLADLRAVGAAASRLGPTGWALLLGLSALGYALRFLRWQGYLRHFGHRIPTLPSLFCYLGGFAFTITPGKAGEAVRSLYLKQRGVGYAQSLAALFSERLLDLVAMLLLALAGALVFPQGRWLLALAAALILVILPLAQHPGLQRTLSGAAARLRPGRLQALLRHGLALLSTSAQLLRGPVLWAGLAVGLLAWGAEGLGFYLLLQYLELPAAPPLALGIYALSLLAGALSFIPGGLGSTEAALGLMLMASGADAPTAVAATLIYRMVSLWFAVGLGALALAVLGIADAPHPGADVPAHRPMSADRTGPAQPLCVDLDGTLVSSDLLIESLFALLKRNLFYLLLLPWWLLGGKARFKAEIAARVELDPSLLPYREELVAYLREQRAAGRRLVLATASHIRPAEAVALHLGLFDAVLASDEHRNLSGALKLARLEQEFGPRGFAYAGDSRVDLPIWARAGAIVLVAVPPRLRASAERLGTPIERIVEAPPGLGLALYARALRLNQWVKNLLLFVPLAMAHRLHEPVLVGQALLAFVSFCLCASSVYLLNDLLDLPADRRHPSKRRRPFASGALAPARGLLLIPLLLLLSFALALALPWGFAAFLGLYYLGTLAYSLWLKGGPLIDVLTLAGLYTLRILAGAAAVSVTPSFWLLAFSMFLFLSLALVKRYTELAGPARPGQAPGFGRGYRAEDLPLLLQFGTASGYLAVLVLALYINGDNVKALYSHPELIWLLCPLLLYLISRTWLLAVRDELHEDPVVFALSDRRSQWLGLLGVALLWLAA